MSTADVLAPVLELLPAAPARILDVGAGTGRDAAWLSGRGHEVTAVEPVGELRHAGMALHADEGIRWVADCLPALEQLRRDSRRFDLVLSIGVWQHLAPEEHEQAIGTLAALTGAGGRVILSLRHGPGAPSRPCFPADPERIVAGAEAAGMQLLLRRSAPSIQQANRDAGVTWTWLCFERS